MKDAANPNYTGVTAMLTLDNYPNRDVDATLMLERLRRHRATTTEDAKEQLRKLAAEVDSGVRDYRDVRSVEHLRGDLLCLIDHRETWSSFCCDDVTHWIGHL